MAAAAADPRADARLDPDAAHPLNAADCVRSQARLADIALGLTCSEPDDREFWRDKAQRRIHALAEDDHDFGLMPHEEAELEQLQAMLVGLNERLQPAANDDGQQHG